MDIIRSMIRTKQDLLSYTAPNLPDKLRGIYRVYLEVAEGNVTEVMSEGILDVRDAFQTAGANYKEGGAGFVVDFILEYEAEAKALAEKCRSTGRFSVVEGPDLAT